jgi:2-amino-4-hydroxy-6-hydroxymethyldihydropteridine diphosphokinase
MRKSETVFIGLGSNLGDSINALLESWQMLGQHQGVSLERLSLPYLSAPVGMTSNFWFTNAVGQLQATCGADEVLDILLDTENQLGRTRDGKKQGYQDRKIDLDLIYFGETVIDTPRLTVPHPHRSERLFVLAPLADIAPDFVDPETGSTILEMHRRLQQRLTSGSLDPQEITPGAWPR